MPREIEALASPLVTVAGWVPDLEPLLREARVHAAPIAFGAGLKGKITQSLAAGLPVVTTAIGAEGLDATDGVELLIADDPDAFAARVVRVLEDSELWTTLSDAGRALIAGVLLARRDGGQGFRAAVRPQSGRPAADRGRPAAQAAR